MALTSPIELKISDNLRDPEYRKHFFRGLATDEIAEQIRELRVKRRLTQVLLAERAGMQQSAISRVEQSDYAGWTFRTLLRIAEALDSRLKITFVPVEELIAEYEAEEGAAQGRESIFCTAAQHAIQESQSSRSIRSIVGQVSDGRQPAEARASLLNALPFRQSGSKRGIARDIEQPNRLSV